MNAILSTLLEKAKNYPRESSHAYISPSNLYKYLRCAAAPQREFIVGKRTEFLSAFAEGNSVALAILESEETEANDGTFLHSLFEEIISLSKDVDEEYIRNLITDKIIESGSEKLREDISLPEKFTNVCLQTRAMLKNAVWYVTELRVVLPKYAMWGTADLVFQVGKTLAVWDLKTGRQEVKAENNEQLLAYTMGVLDALGWKGFDGIQLAIIGVRFPISTWDITIEDVKKFRDEVFEPALQEAYKIGVKGTPGPQCMYCKAKLHCPEWNALVRYHVDEDLFAVGEDTFKELSNEVLVDRFLLAKQVERFQEDAKNEIALRFEGFGNMDEEKRVKYVRPMPILQFRDETEAAKFLEERMEEGQLKEFVVKKAINPSRLKSILSDEDYSQLVVEKSRKPYVKMA